MPTGRDWLFEVKWDGYRLAIHIERKDVRIITRGGHDWTHRFPAIAAAARELNVHTAILDGEAVVLDGSGRSDFGALQRSLGGRGGKRVSTESILMAFDLLYLDGHDLTGSELSMRRHLLEDLVVPADDGAIRLSEEVDGGWCPISWNRPARSGSKASSPSSVTSPIAPAGPATG